MPQVKRNDLVEAVKILRQNGIRVTIEVIPSGDIGYLNHSQKTVNQAKVANIIRDIKRGVKMPPMITSQDYYIVDGHHRYIAYKTLNAAVSLKVLKIHLPKKEAILSWKGVEKKLENDKTQTNFK